MADMVYGTDPFYALAGQHSDIRREAAEHTNEIVKEGLKESFNIRGDVKDARYDVNSKMADRFFDTGRDLADIRAQIVSQQQQVVAGFLGVSKDTEIATLKTQVDAAKNTASILEKVASEGNATRELINELKNADLNRALIERNALLAEERGYGRFWRHGWDQAQFASVSNQLQAFGSQLQETRQGMVNFGTMAGVGQTSTSNNA